MVVLMQSRFTDHINCLDALSIYRSHQLIHYHSKLEMKETDCNCVIHGSRSACGSNRDFISLVPLSERSVPPISCQLSLAILISPVAKLLNVRTRLLIPIPDQGIARFSTFHCMYELVASTLFQSENVIYSQHTWHRCIRYQLTSKSMQTYRL